MLTIKNVDISAGGKLLLKAVNLEIKPGELVALCGPSGSGKTTLLRVVSGLIDCSGGEILFNGEKRESVGWTKYRRKVILIEQEPVLLEGTVEENLQLPFRFKVTAGESYSAEIVSAFFDSLSLEPDIISQDSAGLSVGQKQHISFIRALMLKPDVILLDEPTSALDADAVRLVEKEILRRAQMGLGALMVTHDRTQAARICHKVIDIQEFSPPGNSKIRSKLAG